MLFGFHNLDKNMSYTSKNTNFMAKLEIKKSTKLFMDDVSVPWMQKHMLKAHSKKWTFSSKGYLNQ